MDMDTTSSSAPQSFLSGDIQKKSKVKKDKYEVMMNNMDMDLSLIHISEPTRPC